MKAFLILEDGTVFEGTSIGSTREVISEIVFNTSMTGYLEVLTDPSYAGQAVTMTYPLIGNYGVCYKDMESQKAWPDGYIVRELSRMASNFRNEDPIQKFLLDNDIPGICGIDTRALTKILREKGTMNGMITTNENYNLDEVLPKIKEYSVKGVVRKDLRLLLWTLVQRRILQDHLITEAVKLQYILHILRQKRFLNLILMELCYLTVLEILRNV